MGPAIAIYTSPSLLMLVPVLLGVTFAISQVTPGDPGFNSAIAGHFGVPVALVCGDDTVDTEMGELLPSTERVVVKWALSPPQSPQNGSLDTKLHLRYDTASQVPRGKQ